MQFSKLPSNFLKSKSRLVECYVLASRQTLRVQFFPRDGSKPPIASEIRAMGIFLSLRGSREKAKREAEKEKYL